MASQRVRWRAKAFFSGPRKWLLVLLGPALLSLGCNFAALSYFLLPWMEDKVPPKVPLMTDKKEATLAIQASFASPPEANPDFVPEFRTADKDLCERLGQAIKKRFDDNRERIKIIPYYQVRSFANRGGDSRLVSAHDVGKHFNADYVINLEINGMSFYEYGSKQLLHGKMDMTVTVFNMNQPDGAGPMFDEVYRTEFPNGRPIDAAEVSLLEFRSGFLNRVAKDLSRWFAASPRDERRDFD